MNTTMPVSPLSCAEVVRQLWDWLDQELDQPRWLAIQHHLVGCTGCSEHVAFARRFLERARDGNPESGDNLNALRERLREALARGS